MDVLAYEITENNVSVLTHITGASESLLKSNIGFIAYRNSRMRWMLAAKKAFLRDHPNVELQELKIG